VREKGQSALKKVIAVCIATRGRADGLAAQLERLTSNLEPPDCTIKIVVADNNPDGSALPVVERARARGGHPITYVAETQPGISYARNASFAAARPADWVAVCDDDDVVPLDWLLLLFKTSVEFQADAVIGSYQFDSSQSPRWMKLSGLDRAPSYVTGTRLDYGITTSCLVSEQFAFLHQTPFPVELALSAGEDLYFFRRLLAAGAKIVWCAEAVVTRTLDADRSSLLTWLRRWQGGGANTAYIDMVLSGAGRSAIARAAMSGIFGGFRQIFGELRRGRAYQALRGVQSVAIHVGRLGRTVGIHPQLYRPQS
jgi:glycosyltransferase involved in cell wall biosynthesis